MVKTSRLPSVSRSGIHADMKAIPMMLAAGLSLLTMIAVAEDTKPAESTPKPAAPKKIGTSEAAKYVSQDMVVTGKVAQVSIREKIVHVNLDKKYPDAPFSCVIFSRSTNQFGDVKKLEGKQVEVKGKIETYKDKPQIVLNSTNQLKVLEEAKAEEKK